MDQYFQQLIVIHENNNCSGNKTYVQLNLCVCVCVTVPSAEDQSQYAVTEEETSI